MMRGMAFLPIWHDIDPGVEIEFDRWHTVEHMPERLYTPGIVTGRRYENPAADRHRYFVLYEAVSFDVFASEGYYVTGNARSEWTKKMHVHFQNFMRSPCHLVMTRGRGIGGAMATVRVRFPASNEGSAAPGGAAAAPTPKDNFTLAVRPLVETIAAMDRITGVHAGVTAPVARAPLSSTSLSLRPNAMAFEGVLMIEATGRDALDRVLPAIVTQLDAYRDAIARYEIGVYDLSYVINSIEGSG